MNLRLFMALDEMMAIEKSPVTTIRWPVDADYEIIQGPAKDRRLIDYLNLFFTERRRDPANVAQAILNSAFEAEQEAERRRFVQTEVRRSGGYSSPPASVGTGHPTTFGVPGAAAAALGREVVFYAVGMRRIRSDPYTGMAILYAYLYCGGLSSKTRSLLLGFPHISIADWRTASRGRGASSKTIRLFRLVSDGIVFSDGYLAQRNL